MATSKTTKGKTAVFILLLLLIFIGLDIVLGSIAIPFYKRDMPNLRSLHPFYNHGFESNAKGIANYGPLKPMYYTNSLGLKDAAIRAVADSTGKYRILFLGDSFTEGVGYPWDSTFCGLLATKMDLSKTEILNGGVASSCPKLYYLKAKYLIDHQKLKVNEIYCFLDFSDVSDELVFEDFEPKLPTDKDNKLSGAKKFYRHHSLAYLFYTEVAINAFCKKNNVADPYLYWVATSNNFAKETDFKFANFRGNWLGDLWNEPVTKKAIGLVEENILNLQALCNEHHIKFHLVIYPDAYHVYADNDKTGYWISTNDKKYVQLWQGFANQNQIDFINLFPLFVANNPDEGIINRTQYYIPGDPHWNYEGHKMVADSIYAIMQDTSPR